MGRAYCTAVASSWPGHQEAAVALEIDHRPRRVRELGGDRRRQPVAHRAGGGGELRAVALVLEVAVHEGGVVAGAVGDDAVLGQHPRDGAHDVGELHRARQRNRLQALLVAGAQLRPEPRPGDLRGRLEPARAPRRTPPLSPRSAGRRGRPIPARRARDARAPGTGLGLGMSSSVYWLVVISPSRAPTTIRRSASLIAARQLGVDADAGAADVAAVAVVDVVLVAERRRDRQIEALGEGLDRLLDLPRSSPARRRS